MPGQVANQALRQSGPNTGDAQDAAIPAVTGLEGAVSVTIAGG